MPALAYSLESLPDLTLAKYQSLAESGVAGVLECHVAFLRQWHGICQELNLSIHLAYIFDAAQPKGRRLRILLFLQGSELSLEAAKPLINRSPLSDYYAFHPTRFPEHLFKCGATLAKQERADSIFNPLSGRSHRINYVPAWETNENCRLVEMLKMLETVGMTYARDSSENDSACAYRIDLFPSRESAVSRKAFETTIKSLKGDFDIRITDDSRDRKRDDHALDVCRTLEDWLDEVETSPVFRANVYAFAPKTFQAKFILNAAASESLKKGNCMIAPIKPDENGSLSLLSRLDEIPKTYSLYDGNEATVQASWSTTYTLEEALPFFRLPALHEGESLDIPKETAPPRQSDGISFGLDQNGYDVLFPIHMLTKHAFVTGMPGSGKTNTMLHIATELHMRGIPFLILEPAKKEYRELLLRPDMSDVLLFSPHVHSTFPLQINPFQFPVGVRVSEHINALLSVFRGSFVLEGPTYAFLSRAIQSSYESCGWEVEDVCSKDESRSFPTLQDVYRRIETEIDSSYYDSEIKGNVRSFLQVRLGGLMERDAGELFNARISTLSPEEWVLSSAIVELEVLDSSTSSFFILLLCQYVLETLRAHPAASPDMEVRHAIFFEEAHNVIASDSRQQSSDSVDPKVSATEYIVKMLAEVRALREALIVADQLPTTIAAEVTKNTGLKVVHRLSSQDDRQVIGSAITASATQVEQMNGLSTGEAFLYYEGVKRPFKTLMPCWSSPDLGFDFSVDEELVRHQLLDISWQLNVCLANWCLRTFDSLDTAVSEYQAVPEGHDNSWSLVEAINRRLDIEEQISRAKRWLQGKRNVWKCAFGVGDGVLEDMFNTAEQQLEVYYRRLSGASLE